jgi:hypothetical protein
LTIFSGLGTVSGGSESGGQIVVDELSNEQVIVSLTDADVEVFTRSRMIFANVFDLRQRIRWILM